MPRKTTTREIVILKGVRRSGKSTILINTIKRLIADGTSPDASELLLDDFFQKSFPSPWKEMEIRYYSRK